MKTHYAFIALVLLMVVTGAACQKDVEPVSPTDTDSEVQKEESYGLPVVEIFTEALQPVTSKETYVSGTITVKDTDKKYTDGEEFKSGMKIKGRGNTTWDDPTDAGSSVSHIYFNLTENEIRTDHGNFQSDFFCENTADNYFVKMDSVFYSGDYYSRLEMEKLIINRLENGEHSIQLRFISKEAYDSAVYELITQGKAYDIQEDIKSTRPWLDLADEISYSNYDRFYVIELMF